jgi:transcriptional regulator with XRE-family HTH domain
MKTTNEAAVQETVEAVAAAKAKGWTDSAIAHALGTNRVRANRLARGTRLATLEELETLDMLAAR